MSIRVAINGFGRIGRTFLRVALTRPDLEVVALNDPMPAATAAHLLRHDSVHGRLDAEVAVDGDGLRIDGRRVRCLTSPVPASIPWTVASPSVVVEASGRFASRAAAAGHLGGSVERVVIAANAEDADLTVCLGVNGERYDPSCHRVVSNASCTTNCIAPVLMVVHRAFGVELGLLTTVHCYTNDQGLLDQGHRDLRRARAAAMNLVPTSTGAARAIGLVLPELADRLDGQAVRVPVPDGSMAQLVLTLAGEPSLAELERELRRAATGPLQGLLGVTREELVSSDFVGDPRSGIVDLSLLQQIGRKLYRIVVWYDNEWGYAHRLADLLELMGRSD